MNDWYRLSKQDVLTGLDAHPDGLSSKEAANRLKKYGENALAETGRKGPLRVFFEQFADLMVLILIAAALISAFTGDAKSTAVIIVVLVINAILGTVQHIKAEKSLDALKSLSSPMAKVMRDGKKTEIDSKNVVPGDIIMLEAGDMVTADARIIENYSLKVNESSLTGESVNVDKRDMEIDGNMPLGDRINMVYSGSLVTYGRCLAVVCATGMETEIGNIAALMNNTKEKKTPLQVSLDQFSKRLAIMIMAVCLIVFLLCLFRQMTIMDSLLFAVALAVAAIPEALSSIVTIVQAMGTQKMAREQAIIKDLAAVESLGCVSVICSDKTGTLTQNKMTVQSVYVDGRTIKPESLDADFAPHKYLLYNCVLANDSSISDGRHIGDPTETALLEMHDSIVRLPQSESDPHRADRLLSYYEADMEMCNTQDAPAPAHELLRNLHWRMDELPFDSDRKLMSSKHMIGNISTMLTKGAPDVLVPRCVNILTGNGVRPITQNDIDSILAANGDFSENGLRVLGFAYKETDAPLNEAEECDYTFIGLVSEMDPPRDESVKAVADAKNAGIRTVMITGDHKVTATAIARMIGIFEDGDMAVTGQELDEMSDERLDDVIERISVYARVSPENKIRIVNAWQRKGRVVSMTGDGVNDAPALKKADIGVAMGQTGTEVSKDAASMILADDNFATIIKAVANGRTVFANIRNAVLYLISGNFSAIIAVLFTSIMALPVPFKAVQLLFINLVTDSLPALAIGMEPGEYDVLRKKPRDPSQGIMDGGFLKRVLLQGCLIAVCVICAYMTGLQYDSLTACAMAFSTLTLARLAHGFNCRSAHSLAKIGFRNNKSSLGAFVIGITLISCVMLIPVLMDIFSVVPLAPHLYVMVVILAFIPTIIIQASRMIAERLSGA